MAPQTTVMSSEHERYDAVVIGSGFGGSITALRLAEAGHSVIVLERGRRYLPGEFPRNVADVDRLFWRYPRRANARGLFDVRFFSGLGAICASGVGGGSLIYANIHIRPDAVVFDDPRWPAGVTRTQLDPYYKKVAERFRVQPLPEEISLPKRDAFRRAAAQLNREVFDPDMAVSWVSPDEPGRAACALLAECEFGCNVGAKNTLDFTYLRDAERLGAIIKPNSFATCISPSSTGYEVRFRNLDTGNEQRVHASRVVLSAGTLGTNELLLRCRNEHRTLPNISRQLGRGYSANGDFLGSIQNAKDDLQPWHGPDVTSVMKYFEIEPGFTLAAPTFNRPVMNELAYLGRRAPPTWLHLLGPILWRFMPDLLPLAFKRGWIGKSKGAHDSSDASHLTNLFAIGRDNANGTLELRRSRLDVTWNYQAENSALIQRMLDAMSDIARAYGGTVATIPTWNIFKRPITVHSLGGCAMADTRDEGVVSTDGEVFGYPGLFIADGSVIPTSIGFHPVMTICAIAERTAANLVDSFTM